MKTLKSLLLIPLIAAVAAWIAGAPPAMAQSTTHVKKQVATGKMVRGKPVAKSAHVAVRKKAIHTRQAAVHKPAVKGKRLAMHRMTTHGKMLRAHTQHIAMHRSKIHPGKMVKTMKGTKKTAPGMKK
jgi:hypothetical protein